MDTLIIENVRPWDGSYELDIVEQPPSYREWGWIKRFSGYLPLTIEQGMAGGDPELYAAFAVMALHRSGRIRPEQAQDVYDRFADAPFGATIRLELGQPEGDDAGPPDGSSAVSGNGSGAGSRTSSDNSEPTPLVSGIPGSDTSASPRPALLT